MVFAACRRMQFPHGRHAARQFASVAYARRVDLFTLVDDGERHLEVAVFTCVRRELVCTHRHIAPLKAFTDVPDIATARPPGREMRDRAFELHEILSAHPLVRMIAMA